MVSVGSDVPVEETGDESECEAGSRVSLEPDGRLNGSSCAVLRVCAHVGSLLCGRPGTHSVHTSLCCVSRRLRGHP